MQYFQKGFHQLGKFITHIKFCTGGQIPALHSLSGHIAQRYAQGKVTGVELTD
jgi:hypothetical protein